MADIVPHKDIAKHSGTARNYREQATHLEFEGLDAPVTVVLRSGERGTGTCLGCYDAPCMWIDLSSAVLPKTLMAFPRDPDPRVCPTRAITWKSAQQIVDVSPDLCIGCGLCAARCPYGAISITSDGTAHVVSDDPDSLAVEPHSMDEFGGHPIPTRTGAIGQPNSSPLADLPTTITNLEDSARAVLVRNLLTQCGLPCLTRRRGDQNVRMDGVFAIDGNRVGVVETEFGTSVLESPRSLLEAVAVLHGRYDLAVSAVEPLSVVLHLPNNRSEYFQVIQDIDYVLGIRCRSVTVGALAALMWRFTSLATLPAGLFSTQPGSTDLLVGIRETVAPGFPDVEPYPASYRPVK